RVEALALGDGAVPAVEVGLSSAIEPVVKRLADPPRVYVDLREATLAPSVARSLAGAGAVKQVRLGQYDAATVRVVVELDAPVPVDVQPAGAMLRLVVGGKGTAGTSSPPPAPAPRRTAAATPAPAPAAAHTPAPHP